MSNDKLKTNDYYNNWATKIVVGLESRSYAEEAIQSYWYPNEWWDTPNHPVLFEIGGDPYDHSLELYVGYIDTDEKALSFFDEKVTKEFYNFIAENGVRHFWINLMPNETRDDAALYDIAVSSNSKQLKRFYKNFKLNEANYEVMKTAQLTDETDPKM
jgi:hypothetical protein